MAPASTHEKPKSVLHTLVGVLRDELDIDVESLGSTTLKKELRATGAEPDDCFYVQNAPLVIGKEEFDFQRDPPPDIVVEVDRTNASLDKFPIYAGLGVPEIWRLARRREALIYLLAGDGYEESLASRAFPFLTAQTLSAFLEQGLAQGERKAAHAFRAWVREHSPKQSRG